MQKESQINILSSSDSQASATSIEADQALFLSVNWRCRSLWCSNPWVCLLFILNCVLFCSRSCIGELWMNMIQCCSSRFARVLIYICFLCFLWGPEWESVCLKGFKKRVNVLAATTHHLQRCPKCLWHSVLKENAWNLKINCNHYTFSQIELCLKWNL